MEGPIIFLADRIKTEEGTCERRKVEAITLKALPYCRKLYRYDRYSCRTGKRYTQNN